MIDSIDAEMQFANGNDETDFENLIVQMVSRRMAPPTEHGKNDRRGPADVVLGRRSLEVDLVTRPNTQRLPAFLRNVTPVIEKLLDRAAASLPDPSTKGYVDKPGLHERHIILTMRDLQLSNLRSFGSAFVASEPWVKFGINQQTNMWQATSVLTWISLSSILMKIA